MSSLEEDQAQKLALADLENHDRADGLGPADQGSDRAAGMGPGDELPAGSRRQAAPVGLDGMDARPPVGEVVRLGEELPDVLTRREQLSGGDHTGHGSRKCCDFGTDP